MKHLKIGLAALIAIMLLIIVIQNTQSVETRILFMTISMPRAVLLLVTLITGFVLGLLAAAWLGRKRESETKIETDT